MKLQTYQQSNTQHKDCVHYVRVMSTGFEICEEFTGSLPATGAQDFTLPIVHYTRANRLKLVGKGFDGGCDYGWALLY